MDAIIAICVLCIVGIISWVSYSVGTDDGYWKGFLDGRKFKDKIDD